MTKGPRHSDSVGVEFETKLDALHPPTQSDLADGVN